MAKKTTNDKATQEFQALVGEINHENPAAMDVVALRQALQEDKALWHRAGDLNYLAHQQLMGKLPPHIREGVHLRLEALQEELGYAESPAIERLLIEQIGTCWLNLHVTQLFCAVLTGQTMSMKGVEQWERRLTAAQRRYLKVIEMLTQVRRRLRPNAMQVNIGTQQVNVAGKVEAGKRKARSVTSEE